MDATPGLSAAEPGLSATTRSKCGNTESAIPTGARNHAQPRSRRSAPGCWLIHFVTCMSQTESLCNIYFQVKCLRAEGASLRPCSQHRIDSYPHWMPCFITRQHLRTLSGSD